MLIELRLWPHQGNYESLWLWVPAFAGTTVEIFAGTTKRRRFYSAAVTVSGALAPAP
jgi:hypothetical protein